ncbi:MON1A [Cordylochernes scorpioides]|uniref:Vacuolar fusion protein MON1 homolog n=1 Tax=Cordylochernes scorpioides TaxID=51811 RepID=A0ABY6K984_9ARAC|nr:MON1A [Cordylochernes scorpioides]
MAEGSSEISIESESENLKKINETELPNDFEPGLSSDSMLLPSGSFDEEDHLSVSDTYDDRRLSNISKIEKSVRETTDEYIPPEEPDMEQKFLGKEEVDILFTITVDVWGSCRYGEEDKLVTLMGVIQALVSVVQGSGDLLRGFSTADKFVGFLVRPPLVLAGVSSMPLNQIHAQLGYLHSQILAMLTLTRLRGIFEKRRNYDLRRLLGTDSARLLNCLVDSMQEDPAFLLGAVRCLPLDGAVRDAVGQAIVNGCSKEKVS